MEKTRPIIILKKKGDHGGHHGGAWKVAYADFVTAMMSLFIVLWLLNTSKQVQEAVGGYSKIPRVPRRKSAPTWRVPEKISLSRATTCRSLKSSCSRRCGKCRTSKSSRATSR